MGKFLKVVKNNPQKECVKGNKKQAKKQDEKENKDKNKNGVTNF